MKTDSLKTKWVNFLSAIFSPVPAFSMICGLGLIFLSVRYVSTIQLSVLLNVLGAFFTSISGAFIKNRYDELSQESILVKKGQSAVRNLGAISQQIGQIRIWIKSFAKKKNSRDGLEEIERHLTTTEVNIGSGIEDWTDIIPELKNEKDRVDKITKSYEETINSFRQELLLARKELLTKSDDASKKDELEKRIKTLEKTVRDLKQEQISNASYILSPTGIASFPSQISSSYISALSPRCPSCGAELSNDGSTMHICHSGTSILTSKTK